MKLLFSFYKHLTEVILPQIALRHKWDVYGEKDIQHILCRHLGIKHPPTHPTRQFISPQELKALVVLCYDLTEDPSLWNSIQS